MLANVLLAAPMPIDSTVKAAIITVLGVIVTGVFGFLGVRYTAKRSAAVAQDQAQAADRQVDVNNWTAITTQLRTETERLGNRVDVLDEKDEKSRKRIGELEDTVTANKGRISTLETLARDTQVKYLIALTYIRDLIGWTKITFNSDKIPPVIPPEIADDLSK